MRQAPLPDGNLYAIWFNRRRDPAKRNIAWSSLGLSMQDSEGWADLPATTRPPQRLQPEAAQAG